MELRGYSLGSAPNPPNPPVKIRNQIRNPRISTPNPPCCHPYPAVPPLPRAPPPPCCAAEQLIPHEGRRQFARADPSWYEGTTTLPPPRSTTSCRSPDSAWKASSGRQVR